MNCPRFGEMQNMLKNNGGQTIKSKPVDEIKAITTLVNMVDVNVTTQSKQMKNKCSKSKSQGRTNLQ
jgi:hypothetical protein